MKPWVAHHKKISKCVKAVSGYCAIFEDADFNPKKIPDEIVEHILFLSSNNLKALRTHLGFILYSHIFTKKEFASYMGVSLESITKWEQGARFPGTVFLRALCGEVQKIFNLPDPVQPADLLCRDIVPTIWSKYLAMFHENVDAMAKLTKMPKKDLVAFIKVYSLLNLGPDHLKRG